MLPTAWLMDQVTAVFELFEMVAVKAWVWEGVRVTLPGVRAMPTDGDNETVALAVLVELAALVAVTVTVWAAAMVAGAV